MLLACSFWLCLLSWYWMIPSLHETLPKLLCVKVTRNTILQITSYLLSTKKSHHNSHSCCTVSEYYMHWEAQIGQPVFDWYCLFIYFYHLGIFNEDFIFYNTSREWVFDYFYCFRFGSIYHARTLLGKNALISICYRMVLTLIMTRVYKDALTLTHPPNISIWLVLQFWYPWAGSFILLLMLIIDTMHPSVFWSNIGSNPMLHANGNIGFMPLFLWTLIVLFSWFVCWEAGIMCRTLHEQPSWMGCFGACLLRVLLHFSSSLWYPWYVWPQNVLRTHSGIYIICFSLHFSYFWKKLVTQENWNLLNIIAGVLQEI